MVAWLRLPSSHQNFKSNLSTLRVQPFLNYSLDFLTCYWFLSEFLCFSFDKYPPFCPSNFGQINLPCNLSSLIDLRIGVDFSLISFCLVMQMGVTTSKFHTWWTINRFTYFYINRMHTAPSTNVFWTNDWKSEILNECDTCLAELHRNRREIMN